MILINIAILLGFIVGIMIGLFIVTIIRKDRPPLTKEEKSLLEDSLVCLIDKKNKYMYKHVNDSQLVDMVQDDINKLSALFNKIKI